MSIVLLFVNDMAKKKSNQQPFSPEKFIKERGRSVPVEVCYLDRKALKECGEGVGVVVRQHTGGKRTVGSYLIDAWCTGIKDAFYAVRLEESEYQDYIDRMIFDRGLEEVPYEELHNWVFGALEYAAEAGIGPHKDFAVAKYLLEDDEDERIPIIEYEFGLQGKHHLVCGSFGELMRMKPLLDANLGKDNYTWGVSPYGQVYPGDAGVDDEEWEDDDDDEDDAPVGLSGEPSLQLTLRIDLAHVKPLVWRKVEVPSTLFLSDFHELLQAVMGWDNYHLHAFRTKDGPIPEEDEDGLTLGDVLRKKDDNLYYEYDFGDGWDHKIELVSDPSPVSDPRFLVLGGKGACPPEDIGGPWIYTQMVELWLAGEKKRLREEFAERASFLTGDFDPYYFDKEDAQAYIEDLFEL